MFFFFFFVVVVCVYVCGCFFVFCFFLFFLFVVDVLVKFSDKLKHAEIINMCYLPAISWENSLTSNECE